MRPEYRTEIVLYTTKYRIRGFIALVPGARLTDYLRESEEFFAITDATVWDFTGEEVVRSKFLDVNRDHVEMIMPAGLAEDA